MPADGQDPVFHSFHRYGHRSVHPGEMVSIRVLHVPCRWTPKRESPRKGAFAHDERRSSWAMDSCLSRFCGSSVVSNNVPVLGFVFRGLRPHQDLRDPVPGKAERLDPGAGPRVDGEQDRELPGHLPVSIRDRLRLSFQKHVRGDPGLLEDRPQGTLRQIAGMIRDGGVEPPTSASDDQLILERFRDGR
jgi:hypothetical protein